MESDSQPCVLDPLILHINKKQLLCLCYSLFSYVNDMKELRKYMQTEDEKLPVTRCCANTFSHQHISRPGGMECK